MAPSKKGYMCVNQKVLETVPSLPADKPMWLQFVANATRPDMAHAVNCKQTGIVKTLAYNIRKQ